MTNLSVENRDGCDNETLDIGKVSCISGRVLASSIGCIIVIINNFTARTRPSRLRSTLWLY